MSAEAVDAQERQAFVAWRRELARLEEQEGLVLTPFEKNLEVWRQLWRVLERSHIVVQVMDQQAACSAACGACMHEWGSRVLAHRCMHAYAAMRTMRSLLDPPPPLSQSQL